MLKTIKNKIHIPSGMSSYNKNYLGLIFFNEKQYLLKVRSERSARNTNNTFNEKVQTFRAKTIFEFEEIDFKTATNMYENATGIFLDNIVEVNYAVHCKKEDKLNEKINMYLLDKELRKQKVLKIIDFLILSEETKNKILIKNKIKI